jgi:hypothetical protein
LQPPADIYVFGESRKQQAHSCLMQTYERESLPTPRLNQDLSTRTRQLFARSVHSSQMINFFPSPARAFIRLSSDAAPPETALSLRARITIFITHAPITHLWPAAVPRNSAIGHQQLLREQRKLFPVRGKSPVCLYREFGCNL